MTGFGEFLTGLRARALAAQIGADLVDSVFADLSPLPQVLKEQASQPESTLPIWAYLDRVVTDTRIRAARRHLRAHRALLNALETHFGVEAAVVVAIWGLETNFGAIRGDFPVLDALATLAWKGRRGSYFTDELIAALRILHLGEATRQELRGSWAGAMGHCQFLPSAYLDFAVDFDGDGRRDIWGEDPTDALASIANYLASHGWVMGQPWGVEVHLPEGFDYALTGFGQHRNVQNWTELGLRAATGTPIAEYGAGSVLLPAGAGGVALLVFRNFHVLMRYNNARAYALAVGHLANRITGGKGFTAEWPRHERALEKGELAELQLRLTRAGFDTNGHDGITGPDTRAALRAWQGQNGLIADGYPSATLLERLRREG